jgi:hypothetical protein
MVCNGDKKIWSKKPVEVRRVKMICNGDKNFGQKNPCKLEELRWFVIVIKKFVRKTHGS